jgi:hypothetical protein
MPNVRGTYFVMVRLMVIFSDFMNFMTLSIDFISRFSGAKTPESNHPDSLVDDFNKSTAHAIVTNPVVLAIELAPFIPLSTTSQIT